MGRLHEAHAKSALPAVRGSPRGCAAELMGWQDVQGGKAVFAVCSDCGARPETEQKVLDKLGFKPMAHCGSA